MIRSETGRNTPISSGDTRHRTAPENLDTDVPAWFVRLLIAMLAVTILTLWLIPGEWLVHWSMWWNNIQ